MTGSKKKQSSSEDLRPLIEHEHLAISIRRQCLLLGINRSNLYYQPVSESFENLDIMRQIDVLYTKWPFLSSRKIALELSTPCRTINRKRVQRLMRKMGIQAIYPKPKTSKSTPNHKIYPYLLRNVPITGRLHEAGLRISMDGRGRFLDNIWIERLWRSAKYEEVYLNDYQSLPQAWSGLAGWFYFYNFQRKHQALGYRTPADLYGRASANAGDGE